MSDWFFYQERGQTLGPISLEEALVRAGDGRLRIFDLVYKEGDATWKMAMEHPDLREAFRAAGKNVMQNRPWVCLRRKSPEALDFNTEGPFSDDEVRSALASGRIGYNDHVWTDGFTDWRRIGSIATFNPRAADASVPTGDVPPNEFDTLSQVIELRRGNHLPLEEPPPPEAEGPDLTEVGAGVIVSPPAVDRAQDATPPAPFIPRTPRRASPKAERWLDWSIVASLIVALGAGAGALVLRRPNSPPKVALPPPPAQSTPDEAAAPEPEPIEPVLPSVVEPMPAPPPRAKPRLELAATTLAKDTVHVELRTNVDADQPVELQIVAAPGQLAREVSYYKYFKFKSSGAFEQPTSTLDLKLGPGHYRLTARASGLHDQVMVHHGVGEAQFKSAILARRKSAAAALWQERLKLWALATRLAKAVRTPGTPLSGNARLRPIERIKLAGDPGVLFFDEWWELHQILTLGQVKVTAEVTRRADQMVERVATLSIWRER